MKTGPDKTNISNFKGFGFGLKVSGTSGATQALPTRRLAPGKPAFGGVSALFRESLESDTSKGGLSSLPTWSKPTVEAQKAQRDADVLQASDPSIFQYDEVIDDIKEDLDLEAASQAVRTNVNDQKKRVGLTLMKGSESVATGTKRDSKYAQKVIVAVDRRRVEQQVVEDRLLKKEKNARKDAEVFVTEAFKEELKRRKKFEEELESQDFKDSLKSAEKMEEGKGFADMYRNLLNGGLATSRGGEKIREQAPAREEIAKKEEVKKEIKEEIKDEIKEEADQKDGQELGVLDATETFGPSTASGAKRAREAEEREHREVKTMTAKERFLARRNASVGEEA